MKFSHIVLKSILSVSLAIWLAGCGGGGGSSSSSSNNQNDNPQTDPKYTYEYEGMKMYAQNMTFDTYRLQPITDDSFNALSTSEQLTVADKLLSSLYFGFPKKELEQLIASGTFISTVKSMVQQEQNDLQQVEERLNDNGGDDSEFSFSTWPTGTAEVSKILARFYVMEHLDKHYIDHWSAYVLSSTIMFSPAYELASSHAPNIERVYSALVRNFRDEATAEYTTFLHMISDDNWRRFRSPEDNGREMMEIYLLDFDDRKVPIAGQALKNWKLNRDNDTLVIGLDENTVPLELFGTTIINGFDFYRELAKSSEFERGTVSRLVDIYFASFSAQEKNTVIDTIVASKPKTWQDILLQIVFSQSYLYDADKVKSAEELFFSLSKKTHFKHQRRFFSSFSNELSKMNQASMKYKLGKYTEVPLDTQSFSTYHKFIREDVLISTHNSWRGGWVPETFISDEIFESINREADSEVLGALIDHLFISTLSRAATLEEKALFSEHMLKEDGSYHRDFELIKGGDNPYNERVRASQLILDYISRLSEVYRFKKVQ